MASRFQGGGTFVAFQPMGIFRFWRNGEFILFQKCLQPLYYLHPQPHPVKSSFFAAVQFSPDPIRGFKDRKKYEKVEGCEQSNNNLASELVENRSFKNERTTLWRISDDL